MSTVQEKIIDMLVTNLGVIAEEVTPGITYEQLSLDSLALIEFTMIIQKELDVMLDDDALQASSTIDDTANLIKSMGYQV